jgi:hypothetical protein
MAVIRNILLALYFYSSFHAFANVEIGYIIGKVSNTYGRYEDDWVEAKNKNSEYVILGEYDFTKGYKFFADNCQPDSSFNTRFFCRSSEKDWVVDVSFIKIDAPKLLYINRITMYSCASGEGLKYARGILSSFGNPKIGMGSWFNREEQKLWVGVVNHINERQEKIRLICKNPGYIKIILNRTHEGDRILENAIYKWRRERSSKQILLF